MTVNNQGKIFGFIQVAFDRLFGDGFPVSEDNRRR